MAIMVKANTTGFYAGSRQRAGAVFALKDERHFSSKWMVRVPEKPPEKTITLPGKKTDLVG